MRFRRTLSILWLVVATSQLALKSAGSEAEVTSTIAQEDAVDPTIVLQVGPITVSGYILTKNKTRFEQGVMQEEGRPPTPAELARWFELFIAQQVLIAHAEAKGYFERAEITRMVVAVERYMLTQPEGPFYRSLYDGHTTDEIHLRTLHEQNGHAVDVVAIRFDTAADAVAQLGADFAAALDDEKLARMLRGRDNPRAEFLEGTIGWPFEPFPDAAASIRSLATGGWILGAESIHGILYVNARNVRSYAIPDFDTVRETFAAFVRDYDKRRVQQERRARVLGEALFRWDEDIANRLIERLRQDSTADSKISDATVAEFGPMPLARFILEGSLVQVSVAEWQQWFNAQFLRRIPRVTRELGESVASMVLDEFDRRAAHEAGLDTTPRFCEDRRNFRNYEALALFEREQLAPGIHVSDDEIRTYYDSHAKTYTRMVRAQARKLTFDKIQTATDYLVQRHAPATAAADVSPITPNREEIVFISLPPGRESEPGFEQLFIASAPGTIMGPRDELEGAVILIREDQAETAPVPLAEVAATIRRRLERRALDEQERRLARELAHQFPVHDAIDYSQFGLARPVPSPGSE